MSRHGAALGAATEPASPIGAVVDLVADIERRIAEAQDGERPSVRPCVLTIGRQRYV